MAPNRIDPPPDGAGLDPRLIEALRAATAALAREPGLTNGTPPAPDPAPRKAGQRAAALRAQLWQLAAALLVSAAAAAGVFTYMRLTADYAAVRGQMGQVRRDVALVRNQLVRKDEFHGRTLAANALIREAEATTRATTESALQRGDEQQQNLADLRLRLDDVRHEIERLRERKSALETRPGRPKPRALPPDRRTIDS